MNTKLIETAKTRFYGMVENTKNIEEILPGYGIGAMSFARGYISPKQDQETYDAIYNIYFDFFSSGEYKKWIK